MCAKVSWELGTGNRHWVQPLPLPFQPAPGVLVQLESFADAETFDPKNSSVGGGRDDQPRPADTRNLQIRKQILQLHLLRHADGLKAVTVSPMAKSNPESDFGRVEIFAAKRRADILVRSDY